MNSCVKPEETTGSYRGSMREGVLYHTLSRKADELVPTGIIFYFFMKVVYNLTTSKGYYKYQSSVRSVDWAEGTRRREVLALVTKVTK